MFGGVRNHRFLLIAMSSRGPPSPVLHAGEVGAALWIGRRAWRVVPSGENGWSPGWREETGGGVADRGRLDRSRGARAARGEAQRGGAAAGERRAAAVAERAARRGKPAPTAPPVAVDVRGRVGAGAV